MRSLWLGGVLSGLVAVVASVPAAAQGVSVIAPTQPTVARWLGLDTGGQFVLRGTRRQVEIGAFQEPRRMRLCIASSTTPASLNVGARVIADDNEIVIPVGHCGEIRGARITVVPAAALGANMRVKGLYDVVG